MPAGEEKVRVAALAEAVVGWDFVGAVAAKRVGASDGCQIAEVVVGSDREDLKHEKWLLSAKA